MNKLPEKLKILNEQLEELDSNTGFTNCQKVIDSVIGLLGISSEDSWKLFTDSQGKIRSNANWFKLAEGFADKRASYKIAEGNEATLDLKAYWMKNLSKSITSWLVALTPNFEDEPFYGKKNIGIDFIVPESADRVLVVLSNHYVIRTLELYARLSVTQQDIFAKWLVGFDFENKAQVHKILWDSFDLEPLNKTFYKGISTFFVELKQHLTKNKIFDDKHGAFFTNRLIGRIVFCWFLDRKGIINPEMKYFDTENRRGTEYYHTKLETLFFRVFNTPIDERDALNIEEQKHLFPETSPKNLFNIDTDFKTPFLNGGLFEKKENDRYGDPRLVFPADFFDRFYSFLKHYNFTTDESTSSFQQVAIDPEMLGRIFENLLAEQVEETGEQARKSKGAFYTPREIVDYMCRESLREYLKTQIAESHDRDHRLSQLLDSKPHEWRDQQRNYRDKLKPYKTEIIDTLDNIKVIDPACGSGAFPMGMLHLLLQCYERLEPRFDPYKNKLEIIKNNLYGVDIEPMAVEISRLRAWLSIIVDEDADSRKIEPLPNLDFKFVCANSLLPLEKGQQELGDDPKLEDKILEIRDKYYNARKLSTKTSLREEYDKLILQKKQKSLFGKSLRQEQLETYHPFDSENVTQFFDPRFMFSLAKFDLVIANPPYIDSEGMVNAGQANVRTLLTKIYSFTKGNWDIYIAFFELGLGIVSETGNLVFITPDKWISKPFGAELRKGILESVYRILRSGRNVFESSKVDSIVTFIRKGTCKRIDIKDYINKEIVSKGSIPKTVLKPPYAFDFLFSDHLDLLLKIESNTKMLSNLSTCENACATSDAYKLKPFLENIEASEFNPKKHLKVINTGTIDKFVSKWGMKEMTYLKDKYLAPVVPKGDFVSTFNNTYSQKSLKKKLIIKGLTLLDACFDGEGYIIPGKSTLIVADSNIAKLKFLLGLVNSKLAIFYIREKYPASSYNQGINFTKDMINNLPVPEFSQSFHTHIVKLVDKIIATKTDDISSDLTEPINDINQSFYKQYELSPEEIAIIEGVNRG